MSDNPGGNTVGREEIREVVRSEIRQLCEDIHALKTALLGPDGEPCKGILVRLDRLEQTEKSRKFWTATAVGSAVAALIQAVFAIFHPGGKP